ncbi:MAG: GMC oxidoreductase [Cyclobacteriaceae bacterium]
MAVRYDLIVVGTGFASIFFLKKYLEKAPVNCRILILERGQLYTHTQRLKDKVTNKERSEEFELSSDTSRLIESSDKTWVFEPNFGGGSNCWTGCTPRFMPSDFKINSTFGVGTDWPISYVDIEPYYNEAELLMSIAGPELTPFPRNTPYPLPSHKLSTIDLLLKKRYLDKYISQPAARASINTENRNACCTSSVCQLCPVNSKFTIENTFSQLLDDTRIHLEYGAEVFSMTTSSSTANSVLYRQNNEIKEASGEVIALGANAIFNSLILLNCGDQNPLTGAGLSEQVGKYAWFYFDGVNNLGGSSVITANGYMFYDGNHRKDYAACLIENHNQPFIRNEYGKWRQIAKFKFVYEDLPQNKNKVTVGRNQFVPKVNYTGHSEYAQRGIDQLESNINKYFSFLPIDRVEIDSHLQKTEAHILGTTRMSKSVQTGVIDKNLIHHKYRNVFVLGGGSFPSISPSNPTLTLSALSLMAADKSF